MTPSVHQSGSGGGSVSWEEKIVRIMDEETAVACIEGIRREERARAVLGLVNEYGVEDGRKPAIVERVRELS